MNQLLFFAEIPLGLSQYIPNLEEAYIILVVVVPVMLGFLLLISLIMLSSLISVNDRLYEIRLVLEDISSDKFDVINKVDKMREDSEQLTRRLVIEEHQKPIKPITKKHKIIIGTLAISIPVLSMVLVVVILAF